MRLLPLARPFASAALRTFYLRQQLLERREALAAALEGARREAAAPAPDGNLDSSVPGN